MLYTFALVMAVLPVSPEPHIWEKWKMLQNGTLTKPLDIFDVFWHLLPTFILLLKLFLSKR
ncbi:hypothetical protein IT568_09835 [bacterium]|nr:hypothetical protein [bacterium]